MLPDRPPAPGESGHARLRNAPRRPPRGYTALRLGGTETCRPAKALVLLELERAGVDAVTLPGLAGAVGEHVTEVAAASGAVDLDPMHPVAEIVDEVDIGPVRRLGEARPAGPRVELRLGGKQLGAAAGAAIGTGPLLVEVPPGEGPFGALAAKHVVLVSGQLVPSAAVGLRDSRAVALVIGVGIVVHVGFDPVGRQNDSVGPADSHSHGGDDRDRFNPCARRGEATQGIHSSPQAGEQAPTLLVLGEVVVHPDATRRGKRSLQVVRHAARRPAVISPETLWINSAHESSDPPARANDSRLTANPAARLDPSPPPPPIYTAERAFMRPWIVPHNRPPQAGSDETEER